MIEHREIAFGGQLTQVGCQFLLDLLAYRLKDREVLRIQKGPVAARHNHALDTNCLVALHRLL